MKLTLESAPNGYVTGLDNERKYEFPFFLLTQPPSNSVSITANGVTDAKILAVSGDGPIAIVAFGHQKTGAALVQLGVKDGQQTRWLCNSAVNVATIFGNNGKPYYLPTPLILPELDCLVARFADASGSTNAVRFSAFGGRFTKPILDLNGRKQANRDAIRQYLTLPYFLTLIPTSASGTVGALTLSALASSSQSLQVPGDSAFQLIQISASSTGEFSLNIQDAATGESLINAPAGQNYAISSNLICGNGNFPFKLPYPVTFKRGTKLLVTVTDLSNATNNIFLTLGGRLIANKLDLQREHSLREQEFKRMQIDDAQKRLMLQSRR